MPPPLLALVVAGLILLAYLGSLWWFLRRESTTVVLGVLLLCSLSLALRLAYTTDYPAGLHSDEPQILVCAYNALMRGDLLAAGCTGMPVLLSALFQAQLVPVLGPGYWSVRLYSLVTSVLATAAAFAAARALTFGVIASGAVSAFIAVLPWSLLYGRISVGGELVFHELLLLAALGRLIWAERAGWAEAGIGSVGLGLLCYDYLCGLSMLAMPLLALLVARGRRLACLAIFLAALGGYVVYGHAHPDSFDYTVLARMDSNVAAHPFQTMEDKGLRALRTFIEPVAVDQALTVSSGAMHPRLILGLAVLGLLCARRRAPFLLAGFLVGLAPALAPAGDMISAHRMLMAFPFVALAAGAALNVICTPRWCALVTVPIVGIVAAQSIRFYFSPAFWPPQSQVVFSADATQVIESLPRPPHPHFVVMQQLGDYFWPLALVDDDYSIMSVDNWLPADNRAALYVFDGCAAPLRPFYEQLVGPPGVRVFGRAFTVSFEARQWSWLKRHGWAYEVRCGTAVQRAIVPVLYHERLGVETLPCRETITHTWRGRWRGAATLLRIYFDGEGRVETSRGISLARKGEQATIDFRVEPGDELRVTLATPPPDTAAVVRLLEVTPATERVPSWESVDPIVDSRGPDAAVTAEALSGQTREIPR